MDWAKAAKMRVHRATIFLYVILGLALANGSKVYSDLNDFERVTYWREACDKLLDLGTSHDKAAVKDAQAACKTLDFSFLDMDDKSTGNERQLFTLRKPKVATPSKTSTFLETSMFRGKKKKKKKKKKLFKKIGKGLKKGAKKIRKQYKKVKKKIDKAIQKPLNDAGKRILGKKNFDKVKRTADKVKKGIKKASKEVSQKASKFIDKNKKVLKKIGTGIAAAGLIIATAGTALPAMAATAATTAGAAVSAAVGAAGSAVSAGIAAVQGGIAALGSAGTAFYTKMAEKMAVGPLADGIVGADGKYGEWLKDLGEEGKKLTKKGKKAVEKFERSKKEIIEKIDFTKGNIHEQIETIPRRQRAKFEKSLKQAIDETTDSIENVYGQVSQQVTGMQDKLSNTYAQLLMKKDGVDSYVDGLLTSKSKQLRRKGENLLAKYTEKGLAEVKFESAAQELKNLESLQLRLANGITNAVEGAAGQVQLKTMQYAQQARNVGHQISQGVQQMADNIDQATEKKIDQVSYKVDDLVKKVSQLQNNKGVSLSEKADEYSNVDIVEQGTASLRALNVLANRAGLTAQQFVKDFSIDNKTKNEVALANTIAASKISEQNRNDFVGTRISTIEPEDNDEEEDENDNEEGDENDNKEGDENNNEEGDENDNEEGDENMDKDQDEKPGDVPEEAGKDSDDDKYKAQKSKINTEVVKVAAAKGPRKGGMIKKSGAAIAAVGATAALHNYRKKKNLARTAALHNYHKKKNLARKKNILLGGKARKVRKNTLSARSKPKGVRGKRRKRRRKRKKWRLRRL